MSKDIMLKGYKEYEWMVEMWNKYCPEGTEVILIEDDGSKTETATKSAAWLIGQVPVVKVVGKRGGYSLDRIFPKEQEEMPCDDCDNVVSCEQCCIDAGV